MYYNCTSKIMNVAVTCTYNIRTLSDTVNLHSGNNTSILSNSTITETLVTVLLESIHYYTGQNYPTLHLTLMHKCSMHSQFTLHLYILIRKSIQTFITKDRYT